MHIVKSKDGTPIAYDKIGSGPPAVLVTGAFGYRRFPDQAQLANELASRFTVYNYDRRGRGDSGDVQPYAVQREIEDLQAVLDAAGGSAYVWGLSSGAVLALKAAAAGLAITKLALHEPPFVVRADDRKPPHDFVDRVNALINDGHRSDAVKYFMSQVMGAPSFVVGMMKLMPGVWKNLTRIAHTLPYDAAILEGYMSGNPLSSESWRNVTMPAAVLEGLESPPALRHAAQAAAEALPNARLISRKGLGHTKKLNARMIADELTAFFLQKGQ